MLHDLLAVDTGAVRGAVGTVTIGSFVAGWYPRGVLLHVAFYTIAVLDLQAVIKICFSKKCIILKRRYCYAVLLVLCLVMLNTRVQYSFNPQFEKYPDAGRRLV